MLASPAIVAAASTLAGRPVSVACNRDQSFSSGELGYTLGEGGVVYPTIYLPASTCNRLNALMAPALVVVDHRRSSKASASAAAVDLPDGAAVDTLIHEATHILEQSTDEARVECDSYTNRAAAVNLFPLGPRLRARVMRGVVATHRNSDPSYLTIC